MTTAKPCAAAWITNEEIRPLLRHLGCTLIKPINPHVAHVRRSSGGNAILKTARFTHQSQALMNEARFLKNHAANHWPEYLEYARFREMDYLLCTRLPGVTLNRYQPNRSDDWLSMLGAFESILHQLHLSGFIHADIKPANLLFDPHTQRASLIDFGCVIEVSHPISMNSVRELTPLYASAEQLRGMPLTPTSDWVALALTFATLMHQHPFRGRTIYQAAAEGWKPDPPLLPSRYHQLLVNQLRNIQQEAEHGRTTRREQNEQNASI
ncbi:protein kinase domain-containing protein [Vibrio proteolyticus]